MSWYSTKEEAEKACLWKEKEYKRKFAVQKDTVAPDCWWAVREELIIK